ncbi:GtrA family protein [uncultured Pseudokineococcus sp.]|uniref:GtrA family protein n=1 Tax=uncultured Pseudokineococcus sp. TaxID=1642928 RepID=UPI00263A2AC8|nr:GtrA family protein [uncultured Pseudokineococcus sp.]
MKRPSVRTLLAYLFVGGLSYIIDLGLFLLLGRGLGWGVVPAATVGYWTSVMVNFCLNRSVVFSSTHRLRRGAVRYGLLLLANYLATLGIVTGLVSLGTADALAKTTAVAVIAVWNFFLYRAWVFR